MTIENVFIDRLPELIAGLVKQGLTFRAFPAPGSNCELWTIQLLGGF